MLVVYVTLHQAHTMLERKKRKQSKFNKNISYFFSFGNYGDLIGIVQLLLVFLDKYWMTRFCLLYSVD